MSIVRLLARWVVVLVVDAVAFLLLAWILDGVRLQDAGTALAAAALVGLANAVLWPLALALALPFSVLLFAVAVLPLNAAVLLGVAAVLPGFSVDGWPEALVATIVLSALTTALSTLLSLEHDVSFHRRVVLRALRRAPAPDRTDVPGVFFLEIDGLAEAVLRRAVASGHAPTVARWLNEGSHRIEGWECDLSSQTGASQAGLLHGSNHDLPAFRWYEKESGRVMVSNHPPDAAELERRVSDGAGLLAVEGASRGNLCSGDAPRSLFTMATVGQRRHRDDLYAFLSDPWALTRVIVLSVADVAEELWFAWRQRRTDEVPRVHRGGIYPLLRAATTVALRDLALVTLIGDVLRGVPVAYATFVGYDEVAHHSGVERPDALRVLRRLDRQFGKLERAAVHAPRPYRFVVLSDHGQSQGAPFRQTHGETLEELVRRALSAEAGVTAFGGTDEGWAEVSTALTEAADHPGVAGRLARRKADAGGTVALGEARDEAERHAAPDTGDIVVMASGCLGLVYLPGPPRRLTLEEIDERHPDLVRTLAEHPGIGFVLVRTEDGGPLAIGPRGTHMLATGTVEGDDPLAPFGATAVHHLRRTDGFPHAPDLLLNGAYDPATGTIGAFEDLVGHHGGLGGAQQHPFAVVPADWSAPAGPIVGAGAMHEQLRTWLAQTGRPPATRPETRPRARSAPR